MYVRLTSYRDGGVICKISMSLISLVAFVIIFNKYKIGLICFIKIIDDNVSGNAYLSRMFM